MPNVAELAIKVTTNADKAADELDKVGKKAGGFSSGLNKAAAGAAVAGAAVVAFGKSAMDAASDAQQAAGAVDAIYGTTADTIHKFASTSATDVGVATSEYENMAAVFGAQLKNMGVATEDLAPQTDDLIGLGADLAAQFGGSTADAVAALSSLMKGEADPIEEYGVAIKKADVAAKKAEMGLGGLTGEADKAADTQAMLALLTEQTADATGAFARESNTAAGQTQRANAQWKDTQAALGTVLLPIVAKAMGLFSKLSGFVKDNASAFQILGGVVAGIAAVILTVKAATMAWQAAQMVAKAATMAWTAVQWLLNAAMTANPIGLVILAVAALIGIIIVLVKNWDKVKVVAEICMRAIQTAIGWVIGKAKELWAFISGVFSTVWAKVKGLAETAMRGIVTAIGWPLEKARDLWRFVTNTLSTVWDKVKNAAVTAFGAILSPVQKVIDIVQGLIDKVMSVIGWIGKIKLPDIGGFISGLNPFAASTAPVRYAAPTVAGHATRSTTTGGAGGITINVTGALDPDAVARQIDRILRSRSRRVGGVGRPAAGVR